MSIRVNDYKLKLIFGRKGCGKSCTLARLGLRAARKGQHVYSNVDLDFSMKKNGEKLQSFVHFFNPEDFGYFKPEVDGLFLIDEVNVIWDNRDYKKFDKLTQKFFRYQRHYHCTCIVFSQTFDTDKKIRDLCDELWIQRKLFRFFSCSTRVNKYIYVVPPDQGESNIVEAYEKSHFWELGSRDWTFLPKYWMCYDSFSKYSLPTYEEFMNEKIT